MRSISKSSNKRNMEVIKEKGINIEEISQKLKSGQTIVYPTETCYGLGCDATNGGAVDKIFKIKSRQEDKPVLMIVSDIAMAMEYVEWSERLDKLAKLYWPGAFTVVVRALSDSGLAKGVVAQDGTVAFRVTNHPLSSQLSQSLNKPLVSTSANIASMESPYDIETVLDMFATSDSQPDLVIDAGTLTHKSPSTVVRINEDGGLEVLRQGEVII